MGRLAERAGPHGLTTRQAELVRAIYEYLAEHGRPPSLEELSMGLGVGRSRISQMLARLAEMGWVEQVASRSRTLSIKGIRLVPTFEPSPDGCRVRSLLNRDVPHFEQMQELPHE